MTNFKSLKDHRNYCLGTGPVVAKVREILESRVAAGTKDLDAHPRGYIFFAAPENLANTRLVPL